MRSVPIVHPPEQTMFRVWLFYGGQNVGQRQQRPAMPTEKVGALIQWTQKSIPIGRK